MKLTLTLTGDRPVLLHNGRLANPLDPYTQQLKALTSKRKKTDDDLIAIMRVEARGGAYETSDNLLAFPTQNVWRSIYDAAKAYKRGEDIKRALLSSAAMEPLYVNGQTVDVDEYLSNPEHIDYRPVAVQRAKTMRARPVVHGWSTTHHFELLDDVIDPRDLGPIIERAGRLVGIGDWRPTFGGFTCEAS